MNDNYITFTYRKIQYSRDANANSFSIYTILIQFQINFIQHSKRIFHGTLQGGSKIFMEELRSRKNRDNFE